MILRRCVLRLVFAVSAAALLGAAQGATAQARYPDGDVAHALAHHAAISSRRASLVDSSEAARRLAQAQLERAEGALPQPGEQAHDRGPNTVNPRYWRRQERLRRAVEQARGRANQTRPRGGAGATVTTAEAAGTAAEIAPHSVSLQLGVAAYAGAQQLPIDPPMVRRVSIRADTPAPVLR